MPIKRIKQEKQYGQKKVNFLPQENLTPEEEAYKYFCHLKKQWEEKIKPLRQKMGLDCDEFYPFKWDSVKQRAVKISEADNDFLKQDGF